jgi:hypothetical protein
MLKVDTPKVRAIDRIVVDVDARALRNDSNQRIVTVPASTPDAIDAEILAALGTPIAPTLVHTTLPPAPPGSDEVRVYTIPRFATAFAVAARAPLTVGQPAPGAVVVADLVNEAKALGAIGFEAKHRDVPLRVTGQFLRVTSGTSDPDWVALLGGGETRPKPFVVVYVGHLGTPSTEGPTEVACILPADDRALLARISALSAGDELVFDGLGSTWGAVRGQEFVVMNPCRLAA